MKSKKELIKFLSENIGINMMLIKTESNKTEIKKGELINSDSNSFQCYWKEGVKIPYDTWVMIPERNNIEFIENGVIFNYSNSLRTLKLIYKWS